MSVWSLLLYSFCSYDGDVDIDALVKEPITAGVKGLKVGTLPFYYFLHLPYNHHHHHMCSLVGLKLSCIFQLKGMIRVILEPLIGEAPLVGGVTLFFIRRPVSAPMTFFTTLPHWFPTRGVANPQRGHQGFTEGLPGLKRIYRRPLSHLHQVKLLSKFRLSYKNRQN